MNFSSITPDTIILILNVFSIVVLLLGFLWGLKRGLFKASYRFIVTLVIIFGCWLVFPAIMNLICSFDLSQFGNFEYNGYQITTIGDLFEFITKMLLGLIEQTESGWTEYTGDVVIAETQVYGLIYGTASMVLRLAFMLIIIVLNWTLFRFLFGIVYLIIRPKKKVLNKKGKKVRAKPKGSSRLLGGLVGTVNAIFILFLIFVPISGIFSIGSDISSFVPMTESEEEIPLSLSFGGEVIYLEEENLGDFDLGSLKEWTGVYRSSIMGTLFGISVGEDPVDYATFDSLFGIKVKDNEIKLRKEISVCAKAVGVLTEEVQDKLSENGFELTPEVLDQISGEKVVQAFDELSKLQFVDVVIPIGVEFIEGNKALQESFPEYVKVDELAAAIKEVKVSDLIGEIGDVLGTVVDLGVPLSNIIAPEDNFVSDVLGKLTSPEIDNEKVVAVFDAVANISIIDSLNTALVGLVDVSLQDSLQTTLLLKPRLSVSEDGYFEINGIKSNLLYDDSDLENAEITLNEYGMWVINGFETDIDGSACQMKLDFSQVKLSDEIRNLGNIITGFKDVGITSIASLQAFINGEETDIDWEKFNYDNLTKLFDALVGDPESNDQGIGSKLISSNSSNIYVLLNNILPNEIRGSLNQVPISGSDLASLTLAAKVLVDSGVMSESEEIDFEKFVNEYGDKLVDELFGSNMLTANMTPICNALLSMLTPEKIFTIPEDYDWSTSGKEDVKGFLTLGVVMMKFQDQMDDFSSLSDEELDELFNTLGDVMCSDLMRRNMNNLIVYLNDTGMFGSFKLEPLATDAEWTNDEIKNILEGLKIFIPLLTNEDGESNDLIAKIFQLNDEQIGTLLSSHFLVINIVSNLYDYASEGGALEGFLCLDNIEKDSSLWYDEVVAGEVVRKGELRCLLENALKLFEGVENFDDFNLLVENLIKNIATLENNLGSSNDEISEITNSVVLKDSLIKLMKSLPEKTNGLIVVEDTSDRPIEWDDKGYEAGELRNLLAAIGALLFDEGDPETDEDDVVLYDQLLGDDNSDKISIFLNVNDEKIDTILNSIIIVDTFKGYIIDFSEGDSSFIYLRDPDMSSDEWSVALKEFLKSARILLAEDDGNGNTVYNIDKLQSSDTKDLISLLLNLDDEQIEILTESDIIVDTIANSLLNMSSDDNSIIQVPEDLQPYYYGEWDLGLWREEEQKIIRALSILLEGDADKFDHLSSDSSDLINLIAGLANDDPNDNRLEQVLSSDILTATIANQIELFGNQDNAALNVQSTVDYDLDDWRSEIDRLIHSVNKLLADDQGNVSMDKLNGADANTLFEMVINLTEDELDKVLDSVIITDTIAQNIKAFGEGDNPTLVISNEVNNYSTEQWHIEIRELITSSKLIIAEKVGDEYVVDIEHINMNKILDISSEEEIHQIFTSQIIRYTAAKAVTDTLLSSSSDYIELDIDFEGNEIQSDEERYEMVSSDIENLVIALQDLKELGISHEDLSFDSFNESYNAAKEDPSRDENEIPDTLQRSNLIVHSMSKLVGNILVDAISDSNVSNCVNTELEDDEWKTFDISGNEPFDDLFDNNNCTDGELRKIFALMADLNSLNSDYSLTETKQTLKDINESKVLHGIIPEVIGNALTSLGLSSWLYDEEDRRDLSIAEWDIEIDTLTNIVFIIEDEENGLGLSDVNDLDINDINIEVLGKMLQDLAKSRYIDVENVGVNIESGINAAFFGDPNANIVMINQVTDYTPAQEISNPTVYDSKLATWGDNNEGEISELLKAIEKLTAIEVDTLTNILPITIGGGIPSMNSKVTRLNSANVIGAFLDQCNNSIMLGFVPTCIIAYINALIIQVNSMGIVSVEQISTSGSSTYTERLTTWVNNN